MTDLGEKLFGCVLATMSAVNIYHDLMDYDRTDVSNRQDILSEESKRIDYVYGLVHSGLAGLTGALSLVYLTKSDKK